LWDTAWVRTDAGDKLTVSLDYLVQAVSLVKPGRFVSSTFGSDGLWDVRLPGTADTPAFSVTECCSLEYRNDLDTMHKLVAAGRI
jgi:hypothetical protein